MDLDVNTIVLSLEEGEEKGGKGKRWSGGCEAQRVGKKSGNTKGFDYSRDM